MALAWLYATTPHRDLRDGKKAVFHGTQACRLSQWNRVDCIDTLAAAYAEAGDFKRATEFQKKAISMKNTQAFESTLRDGLVQIDKDGMEARLALYKNKRAYREFRAGLLRTFF